MARTTHDGSDDQDLRNVGAWCDEPLLQLREDKLAVHGPTLDLQDPIRQNDHRLGILKDPRPQFHGGHFNNYPREISLDSKPSEPRSDERLTFSTRRFISNISWSGLPIRPIHHSRRASSSLCARTSSSHRGTSWKSRSSSPQPSFPIRPRRMASQLEDADSIREHSGRSGTIEEPLDFLNEVFPGRSTQQHIGNSWSTPVRELETKPTLADSKLSAGAHSPTERPRWTTIKVQKEKSHARQTSQALVLPQSLSSTTRAHGETLRHADHLDKIASLERQVATLVVLIVPSTAHRLRGLNVRRLRRTLSWEGACQTRSLEGPVRSDVLLTEFTGSFGRCVRSRSQPPLGIVRLHHAGPRDASKRGSHDNPSGDGTAPRQTPHGSSTESSTSTKRRSGSPLNARKGSSGGEDSDSDDSGRTGRLKRPKFPDNARQPVKKWPCPYHVAGGLQECDHNLGFNNLCRLRDHLMSSKHNKPLCYECFWFADSKEDLEAHRRTHRKCGCSNTVCRRKLPLGDRLTEACDTVTTDEEQWLGMFHMISPQRSIGPEYQHIEIVPPPVQFRRFKTPKAWWELSIVSAQDSVIAASETEHGTESQSRPDMAQPIILDNGKGQSFWSNSAPEGLIAEGLKPDCQHQECFSRIERLQEEINLLKGHLLAAPAQRQQTASSLQPLYVTFAAVDLVWCRLRRWHRDNDEDGAAIEAQVQQARDLLLSDPNLSIEQRLTTMRRKLKIVWEEYRCTHDAGSVDGSAVHEEVMAALGETFTCSAMP